MQDAPSAKSRVSFNPHPPVGAGATPQKVGLRTCVDGVSILTRPWGRVQPVSLLGMPCDRLFQSSPARGGGCNSIERAALETDTVVSILTRPWGRVQRHLPVAVDNRVLVSILTRPWGRVQPSEPVSRKTTYASFQSSPARGGGCNRLAERQLRVPAHVSILTRPWGRVQRSRRTGRFARTCGFNPHPPVGAGATSFCRPPPSMRSWFQSSPARGGGCNPKSRSSRNAGTRAFQSSPARGGGCNAACIGQAEHGVVVSILTRPWGRVQHGLQALHTCLVAWFQSSPARGGGCNPASQLIPDRRIAFQSSPARGGGCNGQPSHRRSAGASVSILTRPWGRVQLAGLAG